MNTPIAIIAALLAYANMSYGEIDENWHTFPGNKNNCQSKGINLLTNRLSNPQDQLLQATFNDSSDEILKSIANGADVNRTDENGWAPLVIAVLTQKPIAIETLLQQGANARVTCEGRSLMCHTSDAKSATALVNAGADFLWVTEMNFNAMDKAFHLIDRPAYQQSSEDGMALLESLLDHGYPVNSDRSNHRDYEKNALLSLLGNYHVHQHPENQGLQKALKILIERGANVNQRICTDRSRKGAITPLMLAIYLGGRDAVKTLIDAGADVNLKANPYPHELNAPISPLQYAQKYAIGGWGWTSRGEAVEFLLKHGARM